VLTLGGLKLDYFFDAFSAIVQHLLPIWKCYPFMNVQPLFQFLGRPTVRAVPGAFIANGCVKHILSREQNKTIRNLKSNQS
jgi:hypothetical protein